MHASATGSVDWLMDKSVVLGYLRSVRRSDGGGGPGPQRRRCTASTSSSPGPAAVWACCCRGLARCGAEVHLLGRSAERVERAAAQLVQQQPGARSAPKSAT